MTQPISILLCALGGEGGGVVGAHGGRPQATLEILAAHFL